MQLPDKGIKLVGLIWSTVFLYFQNTKFCASIQAAMATWYICSRVSFPVTIGWNFFFFRTLPNFKTLVAEATSLFKGKWLALPVCAKARALLWRLVCHGKGGGVREAKKIPKEAEGEEGSAEKWLWKGNTRLQVRQVGWALSGRLQA